MTEIAIIGFRGKKTLYSDTGDAVLVQGLLENGLRPVFFDWNSVDSRLAGEGYSAEKGTFRREELRRFPLIYFLEMPQKDSIDYSREDVDSKIRLIKETSIPTVNQIDIYLRWPDKSYLLWLQEKGINVPETFLIKNQEDLEQRVSDFQKEKREFVLKPLDGGGGHLVSRSSELKMETYYNFLSKGNHLLIQEFVPEIVSGEKSLFFFEGEFVYSLLKKPKGYLTNFRFCQGIEFCSATDEEAGLGRKIVQLMNSPHLARIDLTKENSVLIEATVECPSFYLHFVPFRVRKMVYRRLSHLMRKII